MWLNSIFNSNCEGLSTVHRDLSCLLGLVCGNCEKYTLTNILIFDKHWIKLSVWSYTGIFGHYYMSQWDHRCISDVKVIQLVAEWNLVFISVGFFFFLVIVVEWSSTQVRLSERATQYQASFIHTGSSYSSSIYARPHKENKYNHRVGQYLKEHSSFEREI